MLLLPIFPSDWVTALGGVKMDFAAVTREILDLNRERLINIAKKVAIPFAVLPLLWMFFLRKAGVDGQGKAVSKPAMKDGSVDQELDDVVYNLRNLVSSCFADILADRKM